MVAGLLTYAALLVATGVLAALSIRAWRRGESPPSLGAGIPAEAVPVFSVGGFAGLVLFGLAIATGDSPSALTWAGTTVMTAGLLTAFSISLFGRPQALVPPALRKMPEFKPDRGQRHRATIMHVRDPAGRDSEQYYVPTCSCEWTGDDHEQLDAALEEARRHTPNVDTRLERPLG